MSIRRRKLGVIRLRRVHDGDIGSRKCGGEYA